MPCPTCNKKGFIITSIAKDATHSPLISKCPNPSCPYSHLYYQEIKKRFSEKSSLSQEKINNIISKAIKDYNLPSDFNVEVPPSVIAHGEEVLNKYLDGYIERAIHLGVISPIVSDNEEPPIDPNGVSYSTEYIGPDSNKKPNKSRTEPGPTESIKGPADLTGLTPDIPASKVLMEGCRTITVEKAKSISKMMKGGANAIAVQTPFGPYFTKDLLDADRVMTVLEEYFEAADELELADDLDNCIIFPLAQRLGF